MDCELYKEKMTMLQGQVAELQKERDQVSEALGNRGEAGAGQDDSTLPPAGVQTRLRAAGSGDRIQTPLTTAPTWAL